MESILRVEKLYTAIARCTVIYDKLTANGQHLRACDWAIARHRLFNAILAEMQKGW